jgi:hypothetical protein
MALPLANSASGGTAAAAVTTANSGGASGDPFEVVNTGTGTLVFDATHPAHGTGLGYKATQPATLQAIYAAWTTSLGTLTTNQTLFGRVYFWEAAFPGTSTRLVSFWNGTTQLAALSIASGTGQLQWRNNADSSVGTVGTAIPNSTLVRIEFQVTGLGGGTTALGGTARWFTGDLSTGSTVDSTLTGAAGGTLAPNQVRWGAGVASGTASAAFWFDGVQVNATGFPGPEVAAVAVRPPQRRDVRSRSGRGGSAVFGMYGWRRRSGLLVAT